jgi:hypothetical protein
MNWIDGFGTEFLVNGRKEGSRDFKHGMDIKILEKTSSRLCKRNIFKLFLKAFRMREGEQIMIFSYVNMKETTNYWREKKEFFNCEPLLKNWLFTKIDFVNQISSIQ